MKFYCAPLEGLTLFPFRQVHSAFFPGIEKYFTPFLVANQTLHFKKKEIRELLPENNTGFYTVPQVLANKAEEFLWAAREICGYGYREINFNLGCPSPTVVTRGRGAGFLEDPDKLDRFFDKVFEVMAKDPEMYPEKLSVKTRTGLTDHEESKDLMRVYNRYPISELIIHPRRRVDLYKGSPDWDVFGEMMEGSLHPVCYNGDINTEEDFTKLTARFPDLTAVMIGRGLIRDPALVQRISSSGIVSGRYRNLLWNYQQDLVRRYAETITTEQDIVAKMKEVWSYMGDLFPENAKALKQIRKAKTYAQYENAVAEVLIRE